MTGEEITGCEVQLARTLARAAGEARAAVGERVAQLLRAVAAGDVCVDLRRELASDALERALDELRTSPLVGAGSDCAPLVLDAAGRLYLRRLFEDERRVADALLARVAEPALAVDRVWLEGALARLFPGAAPGHRPRRAAEVALLRRLCVISGGPGTGKTTVVARVLALLAEQALAGGARPPRALLLAPTGKAAARLEAAVQEALRRLEPAALREALPARAQTLHRALGLRADGTPRRPGSLQDADVAVVDEASMVDLCLMARLCEALRPDARLILLGDRDQLASVEAGAVLADVCGAGDHDGTGAGLAGCLVVLRETWRYAPASGIGQLARAVQAGDADAALALLADPGLPDVEHADPGPALRAQALAGYTYTEQRRPAERLAAFERFRVLCAHARGPSGAAVVSLAIERALAGEGRIEPAPTGLWEGRPVAIARNDPALELYNGDVGLIARSDTGALRAFFAGPEGERWIAPARLPEHTTAFAQTVHRSQGSEHDQVAILLPREASRVTTRELLYTAVTRARSRLSLHARPDVIRAAIARRSERASGLGERLWGV